MRDGQKNISASTFSSWAGYSTDKWYKSISARVIHRTYGFGKIVGIDRYFDGITIKIEYFSGKYKDHIIPIHRDAFNDESLASVSLPVWLADELFKTSSGHDSISKSEGNGSGKKIKDCNILDSTNECLGVMEKDIDEYILAGGNPESLYSKYANVVDRDKFYALVDELKIKNRKRILLSDIESLLATNNIKDAEGIAKENSMCDDDFAMLLSNHLKSYCKNSLSVSINDEKAMALSKNSMNLLLRARAGSGKTSVLACKVAILVQCYHVDPDQILVLAFNNKAATEVGNRIRKTLRINNFNNARTFHGLACQLVRPTKILFDKKGEFSPLDQSAFIRKNIRSLWDDDVRTKLYKFFEKELMEIESTGVFLSSEDYLIFRRNMRRLTLNGENVKSNGEKCIADFLFEHGVEYRYEKIWLWNNKNYRPDFSIRYQGRDYIIEHWGVDENDPDSKLPDWWNINREEYLRQINYKRDYWRWRGVPLIETSVRDLVGGYEYFKNILKRRMDEVGVSCEKLPDEVLQKKVVYIHRNRITELFRQFIQRAKKHILSAREVGVLVERSVAGRDERAAVFLEIATKVYSEYEKTISASEDIDFDDLMVQATKKIHETAGCCTVRIGHNEIAMKDLKWILVDEFQDFSKLFYELIEAIRKYNSAVRIVCVGDDWQAINSFAGSNLQYFNMFQEYVSESTVVNLLTNFRSNERIVSASNALMANYGVPSKSLSHKNGGEVLLYHVDSDSTCRIESRNGDEYAEDRTKDDRFVFNNDQGYIKSKYLKCCYNIVTCSENLGKSVVVLSRKNNFYGVALDDFLSKLRRCMMPNQMRTIGDFSSKVRISTVHGFKGSEADIVIILEVCEGVFPMIHPNSSLFTIFGQTARDLLDEERRLFYVAVTRAESKLYLLTEGDRQSDFIREMKEYINPQYDDNPFI